MKIYYIILAFWLVSSLAYCQVPQQGSGQVATGSNISIFDNLDMSKISVERKSKVIEYKNIEGSPYVDNNSGANKNFPIGKFYSPELEYIETALARYNAYTDDIEVSLLEDGVDYFFLRKETDFLYIVLGETTYRAYEQNGELGFFVILSRNDTQKCTLLKKQRVVFNKEEKATSSFVTGKPDSFKKMKDTFFFKFENEIKEIPKKKKLIYSLFGEKQTEMKKYIESNRFKTSKDADLIKIAAYYNTLFN